MKTAALFIFVITLAIPIFAQDSQPLPASPQIVGVPFYLDSSAGELKKLPIEPYKNHNPVPGVFTRAQNVEVKNSVSAFRNPRHDKIVFVYDASTLPRLYKFKVDGDKRTFEYGRTNVRNSTPIEGLFLSVSRYQEAAYQFSSDQPLTVGEYAILFADKLYTFGIDAK